MNNQNFQTNKENGRTKTTESEITRVFKTKTGYESAITKFDTKKEI